MLHKYAGAARRCVLMVEETKIIVGTWIYNLVRRGAINMIKVAKHLVVILEKISTHIDCRILDILSTQEAQAEDVWVASIAQSEIVAEVRFRFD